MHSCIHYEPADKAQGMNCGGVEAIHQMVKRLGLPEEIDRRMGLLRMEFRRFLHAMILLPAQIIVRGRRITTSLILGLSDLPPESAARSPWPLQRLRSDRNGTQIYLCEVFLQ